MKLNKIELEEIPALLDTIADYRRKLRVNSANTLDLTMFTKSLQPDYDGAGLIDEILKLDAILAKHEMHYLGEREGLIANHRAQYTVKNHITAFTYMFYSKMLNEALENDTEAFNHIISTIEHKIDHRFPVLNVDGHSSALSTALSPADPHYILTKKKDFEDGSEYNEGLFNSLKNYQIWARLAEVHRRLPHEQFNIILSTQCFSYLASSHLVDYINKFYELLRPGGIALISFIDMSTPAGFQMLCNWEKSKMVSQYNCMTKDYFVEYILKPNKERAPFIIEDDGTYNQHTVLMLRKPGQLKTVKNRKVVFTVKPVTG